ncbi:MAG: Gfo/Idh/MocA family oxidoreductase, partial [Holdemanella sp.]|nr:Gfo/Idh/MocA family oxidoreductase [Holdemanella sp.]
MIRFGILGAGRVAHRFADSVNHIENAYIYAISARNETKAIEFKEKYNVNTYYTNHEDLLKDENIDAIYLSLPHSMHKEWAIKAMQHGKAVLCEKPAMLNSKDMKEIDKVSNENHVLFMEAMKARFVPIYSIIKEKVHTGTIGELIEIDTTQCIHIPEQYLSYSYFHDPICGGALLDSGIYSLSWIEEYTTGKLYNDKVYVQLKDGVDDYVEAFLHDEKAVKVHFETAFDRNKENKTVLKGTKGSITVYTHHRATHCDIKTEHGMESIHKPFIVDDFYGQIVHFIHLLENNQLNSDIMPIQASIREHEIMDCIRDGYINYDENDLHILLKQEQILQFDSFTSYDALQIGNRIVDDIQKYDREISIMVIRERDASVIFQYIMDSKSQRNVQFMEMKRKAVLYTHHSSAYYCIDNLVNHKPFDMNYIHETGIPAGGAFPIVVNGKHAYTVCVSGLHEGKDHEI